MALQFCFAVIPIPINSLSCDSIMYLKIGFLANFAHAFSISGTVESHPDISHSIGHVTKLQRTYYENVCKQDKFRGTRSLVEYAMNPSSRCTHRGYGGLLGPLLRKYVCSQSLRSPHPEFYL